MSEHTPTEYLREDDDFLYSLMHHGWRKGEETFKNRVSIQFEFDSTVSKEEREATIAMMQAAPEMLKALDDCLKTIESEMQYILDNGRLRSVVQAAIAKAKGDKD